MECRNHPQALGADRCAACMEPFCANCLVTLRGRRYCASCKMSALGGVVPIFARATEPCKEASEALKYAVVGIFCFSIIVAPVAISKALNARKVIAANPALTGDGKVNAALVIGSAAFIVSVLGLIARITG